MIQKTNINAVKVATKQNQGVFINSLTATLISSTKELNSKEREEGAIERIISRAPEKLLMKRGSEKKLCK